MSPSCSLEDYAFARRNLEIFDMPLESADIEGYDLDEALRLRDFRSFEAPKLERG